MIKTAITGNIASGKSQVAKILSDMNYKVIDTDIINNEILMYDNKIKNELKLLFGNSILTDNGMISKQKLGDIIFSDKNKKRELECILHKKILERLEILYKEYKDEQIIFIAVPLLFEAGWENNFDKIIFVSAPENERLNRLIKRNNYTYDYALLRINAQEKEEEKIKKSDYVIYNNSDLNNLKKSVTKIIELNFK